MGFFTIYKGEKMTGENYRRIYLQTEHWERLVEKEIYSNKTAKCCICEKKYSLLPHHEKYDNLFHEKINVDVFIVCWDCHIKIHFYKLFFIFTKKTKLKYKYLRRRRLFLRAIYCIQNRKIIAALQAIAYYSVVN